MGVVIGDKTRHINAPALLQMDRQCSKISHHEGISSATHPAVSSQVPPGAGTEVLGGLCPFGKQRLQVGARQVQLVGCGQKLHGPRNAVGYHRQRARAQCHIAIPQSVGFWSRRSGLVL